MNASKPKASSTLTGLSTSIVAAVAYMAGIDWNFSLIDWSIAINWLMALTGLGAGVGYVTSDKSTNTADSQGMDLTVPLGLRVHNPGNLRPSGDNWRGMVGEYKGYLSFDSDLNGLRAMARNLRTYQRVYGLNTIQDILTRYAPEEDDNNTRAYINFVSSEMNVESTKFIDLENDAILGALMIPMIRMEQGQQPFSDEIILEAISLA